MADDNDDKVGTEAPSPAPEEQAPEAAAPQPTVMEPEEIASALKASIEAKLAELGLGKGADGKWDSSALSPDKLRAGGELIGTLLTNLASGVAAAAQQVGGAPAKGADGGDSKVIDLEAARREREAKPRQPSALESRLVGNLKDTFNQFVLEHGEKAADGGPQPKVKIDNAFVRNHGGQLLGALFSAFAGSLLPPDLEFGGKPAAPAPDAEATADADADAGEAAPEAEAAPQAEGDQDVKVQLNVDLPALFRDLFMGKQPPKS